ncbi:hypothetical protein BATDEDRAFT_14424 [Batrachochytrium dendrobatidis JAM81]|uniref:Lariat debranching enzyme C-terminal domain-containing protein n=1 Tax=Batrachochytrium dendrobatidis (strain JAM81 / FGSC 10211) TaxID=684364 RepID=F4PCV6_BATDJ|nr:RNA lariat debranching enzyme [Batrachochytrium dendrobatidis JAM81]EGF76896.1 hypothetical protein BATDEDRAFT_14424 [Batrachochytrium dendrobatidis JAM81]|eukprot:XP_006682346.1 hypothetical protein BATDEDRAFT_14424 [Batrachochytrium dendrobatidis JAM81]
MKVAVQGCCHGELDKIFASVRYIQETQNITIDLLIICGDFQAMRNTADLASMACPDKYKHLGTFYQYYSGQKTVPVPTIFVGGNHEASNYLWELYHGGWVCPNIYFLGFAGCVRFGSVRIAGISGIYKENHYNEGHYERFPYNDGHVRSIYHVRKFNVYRLAQINTPVDIFLSHDWPTGIAYHGNTRQLLQFKKHFKSEVQSNTLGSPPNEFLLRKLKPSFWFAAHLHVKFAALFDHDHSTKFLALDKCLPGRDFLQIVDIPTDPDTKIPLRFYHDEEWLAIVRATHQSFSDARIQQPFPSDSDTQLYVYATL